MKSMQAKLLAPAKFLRERLLTDKINPLSVKGLTHTKGEAGSRLLRPHWMSCISNNIGYLQATPLTANDVGTALAALFHVPVKPTPV
jgi:hypothetical protein